MRLIDELQQNEMEQNGKRETPTVEVRVRPLPPVEGGREDTWGEQTSQKLKHNKAEFVAFYHIKGLFTF